MAEERSERHGLLERRPKGAVRVPDGPASGGFRGGTVGTVLVVSEPSRSTSPIVSKTSRRGTLKSRAVELGAVTTIVAVRHCETDWNREGRMQGWAPVSLNERGRRQAAAAGAWLAAEYDIDAVHASDLLRVRETVAAMREHLAAPDDRVRFAPAWRERDIGVYQGLSYADVEEQFPAFGLGEPARAAAERAPESGESLQEVSDRVTARFEAVLADCDPDETRLVVAHGGPIYALLAHVTDVGVAAAVREYTQDNCGATAFEHDPVTGETRVDCRNVTDWRTAVDVEGEPVDGARDDG
jgi:probable phosphoglycerate mutase